MEQADKFRYNNKYFKEVNKNVNNTIMTDSEVIGINTGGEDSISIPPDSIKCVKVTSHEELFLYTLFSCLKMQQCCEFIKYLISCRKS